MMKKTVAEQQLRSHEIKRIAVAAQVADSTVRRLLSGEPVRPMGRERIEIALRAAGLERLIPC
jgi:DNA-binding LacI/PurR family transcriptional regulator